MDASHMGMIQSYSNSGSSSSTGSTSRPIPGRSTTNPPVPEFEFSLPSVRPGLAKIGRRLTEMSDNFLYESDVVEGGGGAGGLSRSASRKGSHAISLTDVPFMGDEPVFCPFCEKPLPPGLLAQHMHSAPTNTNMGTREKKDVISSVKESASMSKTTSAPERSTSLMSALPVVSEPPKPKIAQKSEVETRMSSTELAVPVKSADEADHAASKVTVDPSDLLRWARVAGVEPERSADETVSTPAEETVTAKPFPKLAPPPEDGARVSSRSSSGFGYFGGKSSKDNGDDDEDESDDDQAGPSGYARLDAPASPERMEKPLEPLDFKECKVTETVQPREEPVPTPEPAPAVASEEEVRAVLKEVLAKVNEMAKSHTSVLHSHSSLLTTLKIARSNLAMAEANAEMLEEQLKRHQTPTKPTRPAQTPQGSAGGMGPPPVPRPAAPTRTTTTPAPLSEIQTGSSTTSTPAVRHSTESARPQSIQIPNSNNPRTPMSASSDTSKGMFGSFWNRNKDKVGEFMNSLPDLTPTAERNSFDFAKSPTSPPGPMPQGPSVLPEAYGSTSLGRSKTVHGRVGGSDSMHRSSSFTNVRNDVLKQPAVVPRQPMDPYTMELTRLRTAQSAAQSKIDSMSKELADLKKGKVEMEAELENLSQALFEEANKMVADERKKRAELEESLKEVKEEREALRETIKVLGGQVEDQASSRGDTDELEDQDRVAELPEFQPRDLDKHYEALRKSIHHVSDNQWDEEEIPLEGLARTTSATATSPSTAMLPAGLAPNRRHSLPDLASPEQPTAPALHDPWADNASVQPSSFNSERQYDTSPTGSRSDIASSLDLDLSESDMNDRIRRGKKASSGSRKFNVEGGSDKLDEVDEYDGQLQADIELDSPKRDKVVS